jgi:hypothetical protein
LPKFKSEAVSSAASLANGRETIAPIHALGFGPFGWAHFRFGHNAEAADRGFASGAEVTTEELKLLLVAGGVGHEFFRM